MINQAWFINGTFREQRHSFFLVILLVSLLVFSTCRASPRSSFALFHRLGPSLTGSHSSNNRTAYEWQKRAALEISAAELNLENQPHFDDIPFVVSSFLKINEPLKIPSSVPLESLDYQISLLPQDSQELLGESGHPDTGFAISSYPLCAFLSDRSSSNKLNEYLNIWIRPKANPSSTWGSQPSSVHNLQLDLLGIQWSYSSSVSSSSSPASRSMSCDGYLDRRSSSNSKQSDQYFSIIKSHLMEFTNNHGKSAIKVSVRKPEKLIEPILKPYPIHKTPEYLPDGTMKEPAPEKGFLAKYWIYILPVMVLLVMGGGPAPEENSGPDQPRPSEAST